MHVPCGGIDLAQTIFAVHGLSELTSARRRPHLEAGSADCKALCPLRTGVETLDTVQLRWKELHATDRANWSTGLHAQAECVNHRFLLSHNPARSFRFLRRIQPGKVCKSI